MYVHGGRINQAHTGDETLRPDWPPRFLIYGPNFASPSNLIFPDIFAREKPSRYTITADQEFIPSINILTIPAFSSFAHIFLRIIRQSFVPTRTRVDSCVQYFKNNFFITRFSRFLSQRFLIFLGLRIEGLFLTRNDFTHEYKEIYILIYTLCIFGI